MKYIGYFFKQIKYINSIMSVIIDNTTTTTIGNAIIGTALLTDSNIFGVSTAWVNNLVNNLNLALNQALTYTIGGIKTVPSLGLTSGTSATSVTNIGKVNATTVDIFPSTQGVAALTIGTLGQPMQSTLVANSWSKPIVVAPAQNSATPYTRIQSGFTATNSSGIKTNFPLQFSVGCIPRVFITSNTSVGLNASAYNVTNVDFYAWVNSSGNVICSWFALGY
jgi:hypothetical protein